ncbi:MAG: co-chaperone DjlA [Gammaproteobacteria bacterium]|nr:co-chaperone DjlA [Gammaproteobacteria bacterium]
MSWWGKLAGGAFGFMLGGPLGALLGGVLGHQFDKGLRTIDDRFGAIPDQERIQTAFFTATFAVMGHLAKSDGRVSASEIALAEQVMRQMNLGAAQRTAAKELFNQGKHPDFPLDEVIGQLRTVAHHRRNLLQMFVEIQIQAALADGRLDAGENELLLRVAEGLGFPPALFRRLLAFIQGLSGGPAGASALTQAYRTLGVPRDASDADVKRAYRRLMNQHHPDKLVAKGLPEEMMKLATEKSQQIRAAYDTVKRSRAA